MISDIIKWWKRIYVTSPNQSVEIHGWTEKFGTKTWLL